MLIIKSFECINCKIYLFIYLLFEKIMFACSGIANELFTDFDRNFIKHRNLQHFGSNSLKNFNKLFYKK